ncbi:transcriptional regulator [Yersinia entomophaga]|uniref:Transcriptional regulator n=1 Tax=Yersinia entomophaga TaxID=935293 RepID=A0ABM6BGB2_YERET|nr:sigma-54 dependent transcriptional regulator [Yersinia entomophaga]ANI28292.1 transcriptional regulator [Yersinia entomophaga]OWF88102.1 transcriptional regulator [Yersinia entomophaga]
MLTDEQQILLIDDDIDVLDAYCQILTQEGYQVAAYSSPQAAAELITTDWQGMVISDVCMPNLSGMALLEILLAKDRHLPILLISGHGDVPMAVEAVKKGAYNFLEKPVNPEKLLQCVQLALADRQALIARRHWQREQLSEHLLGNSGWVRQLRERLQMLADIDVPVFFYGELGTGRSLAARYLHQLSQRRNNPLIIIDPTSDENIDLNSYINQVQNGTLVVKNIERLASQQQRALAQLQNPEECHFRLIALSNSLPAQLAAQQLLVPELYYRFSLSHIECLPLAKRPGDIEVLFRHYLENACKRLDRQQPQLSEAFVKRLCRRPWPGNIRELLNAAELFAVGVTPLTETSMEWVTETDCGPLDERIEQYELKIINEALNIHQGRINDVAEYLQVPRKKLYLRMKKYGIDKKDYRY